MRISSLLLTLLFFACSDSNRLTGFDTNAWQLDKMGCNSTRLSLIDQLMDRKEEITGLGQEEIMDLLGKPDMHELYSRNKKSFTYFISMGPECDSAAISPPKLIIRFDGIGRSKDIIYYKTQ